MKEEIKNLFKKVGASELQISTFQSKEQVLKTESENIKDFLQKEKDITAQNSLELEKLKISETSLQELLKNKVEKESEKKEHEIFYKRLNRKETFSRKQRAFYKRNKEWSPWRFLSEDLIVQTVNKEELSFVKQKDEDDVPKIENAAAQKESMNKVPDVK